MHHLYESFFQDLETYNLHTIRPQVLSLLKKNLNVESHAMFPQWYSVLCSLPTGLTSKPRFKNGCVEFGSVLPEGLSLKNHLESQLQQFHPWRKGPFVVQGVHIDAEWRSNLKWDYLKYALGSLHNLSVLDVGCSNGYFCWRMLEEKASFIVGIDPYLTNVFQFYAVKNFSVPVPIHVLPIRLESIQWPSETFDAIFYMGVLYHQKRPLNHLKILFKTLRSGGQLIIESLCIDEELGTILKPVNRYAKMRNVYCIPTLTLLKQWLKRVGFTMITCIGIRKTTINEQRSTPWMRYESLADFLNPHNDCLTIENLPAPQHALLIARKL